MLEKHLSAFRDRVFLSRGTSVFWTLRVTSTAVLAYGFLVDERELQSTVLLKWMLFAVAMGLVNYELHRYCKAKQIGS